MQSDEYIKSIKQGCKLHSVNILVVNMKAYLVLGLILVIIAASSAQSKMSKSPIEMLLIIVFN